ncbi:MAG TPA: hypothetical protein PLT06_09105 [Syntrophorhabdaceae bacterium]|jgi:hypothetical protein|nr:hypothetical protein [Pseudomonadota bacterium]HPH41765.1 hypothetical protein [Syntrophorhabdaceae bacterium]HQG50872.1 hypothetical protein [Syntrophorhabdaceae bacterium]HQJ94974.1 hypothetical protein [Syntrophorhabdaceae bacterium]
MTRSEGVEDSRSQGVKWRKAEGWRQKTGDRRQKRVRGLEGWRCSEKTERRGKTK